MSVTVLDKEMFAQAEAARLLRLPQGTLHYWLEGGERRGKTYKPIIRLEPRGARSVPGPSSSTRDCSGSTGARTTSPWQSCEPSSTC